MELGLGWGLKLGLGIGLELGRLSLLGRSRGLDAGLRSGLAAGPGLSVSVFRGLCLVSASHWAWVGADSEDGDGAAA